MNGPTKHLLCLLLLLSAGIARADDDATEIKRSLMKMEFWRLGPSTYLNWCEKKDPSGVEARNALQDAWLSANEGLIRDETERFTTQVPTAFPPVANVDLVKGLRAQLQMKLLKDVFLGRDEAGTVAVCQSFAKAGSPLWSSQFADEARQDIVHLDALLQKSQGSR